MKKLVVTLFVLMFCGVANAEQTKNTYAVVWDWSTGDRELVNKNLAQQATQLIELWKKGVVENVYLNTESKFTDDEPMPNVVFFIHADNEKNARKILDKTVFIKKGIAKYNLYPVGILWLIRYEDFQKLNIEDQVKKE